LKILLINKFHYFKGGSETYYFALAELLRNAGHEVIFFAMQDIKNIPCEQSKYFVKNVDYNVTSSLFSKVLNVFKMFYSLEAKKKIKQLIKEEKPDLVHIGLIHKQITFSVIDVIRKYNIPIVFSVHDLIFVCPCYTMLSPNGPCQDCIKYGVKSCLKKGCVKGSKLKSLLGVLENKFLNLGGYYNKVDLYITECEFYKEILERSNFTKSKIVCITNFLPPSKSIELNVFNGDYFLFFGRFSEEKGILTLLKAFKESNVETPLVIIGGGPQQSVIEEFIKYNGLGEKVVLPGYVYGTEMEKYIKECKAVIVPSEWYENCPYSILESMAKSKIVLASKIAGLPELINDETGFLFEPGNSKELSNLLKKIEQLDKKDFERITRNVYEKTISCFSADIYTEKINSVYLELLKRA
jgi:glycosyltransferase involved in cell wall biosynthesis